MDKADARKSFDATFIHSQHHIYRYIAALVPNRDQAEEVFQDTCIKVLEKWEDFDPTRPMVPWACGIAQNMVMKFFQRNRRRGFALSHMMIAAVCETQYRLAGETDRRLEKLPGCLEKLTPDQRSLLDQSYGQRGSILAIAAARRIEPDTLYKRLERIRRNLFDCIQQAITQE
jgi:RNA polymerase sigma-70 factor, ECF subfamily